MVRRRLLFGGIGAAVLLFAVEVYLDRSAPSVGAQLAAPPAAPVAHLGRSPTMPVRPPPPIAVPAAQPTRIVMRLRDQSAVAPHQSFRLPRTVADAAARAPWLREKLAAKSPAEIADMDLKLAVLRGALVCITENVHDVGEVGLRLNLHIEGGKATARDVEPIVETTTFRDHASVIAMTDCIDQAFAGYSRPTVDGDAAETQVVLYFATPMTRDRMVRFLSEPDYEPPVPNASGAIAHGSPILSGPPPSPIRQ